MKHFLLDIWKAFTVNSWSVMSWVWLVFCGFSLQRGNFRMAGVTLLASIISGGVSAILQRIGKQQSFHGGEIAAVISLIKQQHQEMGLRAGKKLGSAQK